MHPFIVKIIILKENCLRILKIHLKQINFEFIISLLSNKQKPNRLEKSFNSFSLDGVHFNIPIDIKDRM